MREPYGEGVATHSGPESCAGSGDALGVFGVNQLGPLATIRMVVENSKFQSLRMNHMGGCGGSEISGVRGPCEVDMDCKNVQPMAA